MRNPLRIFVGFDPKEAVALDVLAHSIRRRASIPVEIIPIVQADLRARGFYSRARGPTESTEFSLTRFLVPFLSKYEGRSVFMDCDMLCRVDITELERAAQGNHALWICKHNYVPLTTAKFLGLPQTVYPRKNWSSLIVFDNARCRRLTPVYVDSASGLQLHRFLAFEDAEIGSLPVEWNWLVAEYEDSERAKILHYTLGGPWFPHTPPNHADEWRAEHAHMVGAPEPSLEGVR